MSAPADRLAAWLEAPAPDRRGFKFRELVDVVGGELVPTGEVALELSEGRRIVAWVEGPSVESVTDIALLVVRGVPV